MSRRVLWLCWYAVGIVATTLAMVVWLDWGGGWPWAVATGLGLVACVVIWRVEVEDE